MVDQIGSPPLLYLAFVLQISLGIVFLLSALPKLLRPLIFAQSVIEYKVLPDKLAYWFAIVVIPLEAFSAVAFLTGWLISIALPIAAVLLLAFLIAVAINLQRGRKIPCGCFGEASEQISMRTIAHLGMILGVILLLLFTGTTTTAVSRGPEFLPIGILLPTLFLAIFLLLLGSWILTVPELFSLFRRSH